MKCFACDFIINDRLELLKCVTCHAPYHYTCTSMTSAYYREHGKDLKLYWTCQSCDNITRRKRDDNTPVRNRHLPPAPQSAPHLDDTSMSVDDLLSLDEDTHTQTYDKTETINNTTTQNSSTNIASLTTNDQPLTLDQLSALLDNKLDRYKTIMLAEMKATIQREINTTIHQIKQDITQEISTLSSQHEIQKSELQKTKVKIEQLEKETHQLKTELHQLKYQLGTETNTVKNIEQNKTIILHGLNEYESESESDLCSRVDNMFADLMNININGFIEQATRIGKRGYRRPLRIDLLSRRMTNYILQNAHLFKNTGYAISPFLDKKALEERMLLRENMRKARQAGKYAIIKNNKLFINGVEYVYSENRSQEVQAQPLNTKQSAPITSSRALRQTTSNAPDEKILISTQTDNDHNKTNSFRE
jgi:hypothetical protein